MATKEVDVLIVGAGPTGQLLALELARVGVTFRLIDQLQTRSPYSRALIMHARSLELLARHGVAEALITRGTTSVRIGAYREGKQLLTVDLSELNLADTAYPFLLYLSQAETEAVLDEALAARGLRWERGTRLRSFEQDDECVRAELEAEDGGTEHLTARYLVGCDGARSTVRKQLGLSFEGGTYEQTFALADAAVRGPIDPDRTTMFLGHDGLIAAMPLPGTGRMRFILARAPEAGGFGEVPRLEEVQAYLRELSCLDVELHTPHWLTTFRLHHRAVDRFHVGRVFVAGDAAHIHSPAGGQGMNTGLGDAVNLGWKLGLALRGASSKLIDSYDGERLPVARWLLQFTDRMFSFMASPSRAVLMARNALLPIAAPIAARSDSLRKRLFRRISQLDISYRHGPAVSADFGWSGGPRPGDRLPDAALSRADGTSTLHRALRTPGHTLLLNAAAQTVMKRPESPLITDVIVVDEAQQVAAARLGFGERPACILVRPDTYVAFRAEGEAISQLVPFLRELYGPALAAS